MNDKRYLELPSHVRIITGADLEEKCNLIVCEETGYGYLLFKAAVSSYDSVDEAFPRVTIVLCFRKEGYHSMEGVKNRLL